MLLIKLIAKKFIGCFLHQIPKNFMIYSREKEEFSWFLKRVSGTKHRKKKSRKKATFLCVPCFPSRVTFL